MDKDKARKLILEKSLITRKISKKILYTIISNGEYNSQFKQIVSLNEFLKIKKEYLKKKLFLEKQNFKIEPRNLPFYFMIKDKIPSFNWNISSSEMFPKIKTNVKLDRPDFCGIELSLSSLIFGLSINSENKNFLENDQNIYELIKNVSFASNKRTTFEVISSFLSKLKKEETIDIISPICPDYAYQEIGTGLYRFTFDNLGSDIGVTAKRLLENRMFLHKFFKNIGIKFNHIAAIGDFEALTKHTLERVKLSQKEFIERLVLSQKRLKKTSNDTIETPLFTEICDGFDNWKTIHEKYFTMLLNDNYGKSNLNEKKLNLICESRKPLLYRWFGKISNKEILRVVKFQGAEYATMGYFIKNNYKNPLVIGCDHFKMAPFYNMDTDLPVLYLTSNYMRN